MIFRSAAPPEEPVIELYDREKKAIIKETVFKGSFLNYYYGTRLGRLITFFLYKRIFYSKYYGYLQNRPASKELIEGFVKTHGVNIEEAEKPLSEYKTFNDFFIRKLKSGARPIALEPEAFIAPADSRLLAFEIQDDTIVPVKGRRFTLKELLDDCADLSEYRGGLCCVFRLAPADYHRFCYIDDGEHGKIMKMGKHLHSVHPLCLQHGTPVYRDNYRELCVLKTKNFGNIVHIDVGAMRVGLIRQAKPDGGTFTRGEEKGLFEFGASTVILLTGPGRVEIEEEILTCSKKGIETMVRYGSSIGHKASLNL